MFEVYKIDEADLFDIHRYPDIEAEMKTVSQHLNNRQDHKAEMIISFLKDHCITASWLQGNEEFVKMIRSGFLGMSKTEALFNACKQNRKFEEGLERYIVSALHASPS